VILGGVLGLIFGFGLAVLLDRLDRRVREPHEAGDLLGRPVLGLVHESSELKRLAEPFSELPVPDADAFRSIRANLRYFNVDEEINSVLVTSPLPGDGKSTVAWHLAGAAANAGERVLLIEADLRRPNLARGISPARPEGGLSEVLSEQIERFGQAPLDGMAMTQMLVEAVEAVPVTVPPNGDTAPSMDVLFAGTLPPNPSDLIESERMAELIRLAGELYDFVVIDTPPTSLVADAVPLVKQVDGVVVVVRLAKSTKHSIDRLREQLENLRAPTLGVVANSVSVRNVGYGRTYYGRERGESRGNRLGTLLRR
jgi:capsular exopolysaccharide synthesis family protein